MFSKSERLRLFTIRIEEIPTLPIVATKLIDLIEDEKTTARDVGNLISMDQAISSRVLRMANSAFYGFPREITSTSQATVILGFDTIKSLALSVAVFNTLKMSEKITKMIEGLWLHSITCAVASKNIALALGYSDGASYFTAGLLHDIGKVIFHFFFHEEYEKVIKYQETYNVNIFKAEKEQLEITHCDIGYWVTKKWKFPDFLIDCVRYHHSVDTSPDLEDDSLPKSVHVIRLADIIAKKAKIGFSGDNIIPNFPPYLLNRINLQEDDALSLTDRIIDSSEQILSFWNSLKGIQ